MTPVRRLTTVALTSAALLLAFGVGVYVLGEVDARGDAMALPKATPDVLLFGSSVDRDCDEADPEPRSLPELVDAILCQELIRAGGVNHGAYYGPVFAKYVRHMARIGYRPRVVVFQINLRSMTPLWSENPNWQFPELEQSLRSWEPETPLKERVAGALGVGPVVWVRRQVHFAGNEVARKDGGPVQVLRDGTRLTLAGYQDLLTGRPADDAGLRRKFQLQFMAHYPMMIEENAPGLVGLEQAGEAAKAAGMSVLYYVTPVDVQGADKADPPTGRAIRANAAWICTRLKGRGFAAINLVNALPTKHFIDQRTTIEHIDGAGKNVVAREIAREVRRLLAP